MTLNVVQPPSIVTPMVDASTGFVNPAWWQFFATLAGLPAAIQELSLSGSPFSFTASVPGNVLVAGGMVSSLVLTRGRVTLTTGLVGGFVPMAWQDTLEITYTVLPDVWFIPLYGNPTI